MIKVIFNILKRIIFAFFAVYGLNVIVSALGIIIPINYFTIGIVTLLGFPGLCSVVGLYFLL